ncbi:LysR family transcriptional regulator [Aquincola sp. MAHUQ-54]|uniref:LysR family transcriptional regulator n=1 Tax=Aquincola agrisoli TaxID=3119538 RepID=A0AAW9Q8K3_9BURK
MPLHFGLKQLEHFIAVAEAGSFSEAAARSFIAQPALSISIRKLEESVGVPLLARGARGVKLTAAGAELLSEARRSLLHAERGRQNARLAALGELGVVRLGFVGSAIYQLLPQRLPAFMRRYPGVRIEFSEGVSITLLQAMREGRMDAGVIRLPADDVDGFSITEVETDDIVAVLPSSHRLADRARIELAELADESFVMFSRTQVPRLRGTIFDACRAAGFAPRIVQEATQAFTMVGLVGSGVGVALMPGVIRHFRSEQVRFIPLSNPETHRCLTLALATLEGSTSPAAQRLCEAIAAPPGTEGPADETPNT